MKNRNFIGYCSFSLLLLLLSIFTGCGNPSASGINSYMEDPKGICAYGEYADLNDLIIFESITFYEDKTFIYTNKYSLRSDTEKCKAYGTYTGNVVKEGIVTLTVTSQIGKPFMYQDGYENMKQGTVTISNDTKTCELNLGTGVSSELPKIY